MRRFDVDPAGNAFLLPQNRPAQVYAYIFFRFDRKVTASGTTLSPWAPGTQMLQDQTCYSTRFLRKTQALFFGSFVSANSGIFSSEGQVLPNPVGRSTDARSANGVLAKKETNFERMRRGLPPLPPVRKHPLGSKPKPRPSQSPCAPLFSTLGYIKLTKSDGTSAGYISKIFDGQNSYTVTASVHSALQVKLPSPSPFGGPFNILAFNGPDPVHPYLGAVGGSSGYYFAHGQLGSAYLAGTGASAANSPPSSSAGTSLQTLGYNAPGESQIWSMDCKTRGISAQWTNSDSSHPPTTIFYDPDVDYLGITSDLHVFNSDFSEEGAFAVTFTFVPL